MSSAALDLQVLVRNECELVASFVAVLGEEQQALTAGDSERLADITPRKTALVGRLNAVAEARNRTMAAAGLPPDQDGLRAWSDSGDEARRLRDRLLQLATEARELNRVNGQLIALRLQHTQAALNILSEPAQAVRVVYGPDGQTQVLRTGYRLIDSV